MLRVLAVSAAAALVSTVAMAADQTVYGQPSEPQYTPWPTYDWSGPYVGVQGGGGWGDVDAAFLTAIPSAGTTNYDVDGGMLGLQVGSLWQYNMVVFGFQADGSWADISGSDGGAAGATDSLDTDYLLSATARVGGAFDHVQPYVLGGVALVGYDYTLSNLAGTATETHSASDVGGTVGVGVEVGLTEQISVFGEYRYYWFDGDPISFAGPGGVAPQTITPDLGLNAVNVGVNWRF